MPRGGNRITRELAKNLLLSSAAGLVAVAGAQAADLPVKAKPVEYVKICSLYGAGFYYIPGTDTCIKIGGFIRAEMNFNANGSFAPYTAINFDNIDASRYYTRVRGLVSFDVRSQTEYGTLRGYVDMSTQDNNGNAPGGSPYFQIAPGNFGSGFANAAFIQFAGFTAGKTISFFDFDAQPYSNQTNFWSSNQGSNTGIPVFAYTAKFGNGFSASLSAEETTVRRSTIIGTGDGYAGKGWPDLVGNLRVDQAWGSAQIMGAIHDVNAGYYTAATMGTGSPGAEVGWALGAGIKFNLPMIGKGDYVLAQFNYAKGALNYLASDLGGGGVGYVRIQEGSALAGNLTTANGAVADATYAAGTGLDLSSGWSITGGFEHWWVPNLKTSLYGAYGEIDYSALSSDRMAGLALGTGSDASWSLWQIGSRTVWTPVPNLDLSVDVMYQNVNTGYATGLAPAGLGTIEDKDWVSGMFRVQRNFYP